MDRLSRRFVATFLNSLPQTVRHYVTIFSILADSDPATAKQKVEPYLVNNPDSSILCPIPKVLL